MQSSQLGHSSVIYRLFFERTKKVKKFMKTKDDRKFMQFRTTDRNVSAKKVPIPRFAVSQLGKERQPLR